ncbi:DnaB-like helicase C-terminal domain-containing protein [Enterococcus sp. AZ180]|uniref:DnaB-like helicase C-terminal domain-containing protein n=1 Tax=Enterococcus sp. AZ180 TaxID=2774961 RepID=UPI003F2119E4
MAKRTLKTYREQRDAIEPQLAASMIYYDEEEFSRFLSLITTIESEPELAPTGPFKTFIDYMKIIMKSYKSSETAPNKDLTVTQIRQLIGNEPNQDFSERFNIWFEQVIENDTPTTFNLSDELFYRYSWLCYQDQMSFIDKQNIPFKEKLMIKPIKIDRLNNEKTFIKISDIKSATVGGQQFETGFSTLSDYIKPREGNLFVIGARPGTGKTAMMLQMALSNSKQDIKTMFLSLEMNEEEIRSRVLNWYKDERVEEKDILEVASEDGFKAIDDNFLIMANKTNSADSIFSEIEEQLETFPAKIVFIDYLQLMRYSGMDEWGSLRKLTSELKQFASRNKILIVTASQLSRSSTDYGADLTSFFGSSTIENDSDIIISMERTDNDDMDDSDEAIINISILKNRQGKSGNKIKSIIRYITMKFTRA